MTKACVMLSADRIQVGPMNEVAGALQQVTHLFEGETCVCVLIVTYPADSPAAEQFKAGMALDGMPHAHVRVDSVRSDAPAAGEYIELELVTRPR